MAECHQCWAMEQVPLSWVHFPPASKMTNARVRAWRRSQTRKQIFLVPIAPLNGFHTLFLRLQALEVVSCKLWAAAAAHKPLGEFCQRNMGKKDKCGLALLNLSPVRRTSRILGRLGGLLWGNLQMCVETSQIGSFPGGRGLFKLNLMEGKLTWWVLPGGPLSGRHHDFEKAGVLGGGDVRISQFRCLCPAVHLLWLWKCGLLLD